MTSTRDDIVELSRFAWSRLDGRLAGLTDAEYLWEPLPDLTTLAWRLRHITDLLDAERNGPWLGVPAIVTHRDGEPRTAAEALALLRGSYDVWRRVLDATTDEGLADPIGEVGGRYFAASTRRAFALHVMDELIHHGAEVALLRDLYRAWPGRRDA